MKRIFFISMFAILATCSVNAQATFNVRAGVCLHQSADEHDEVMGGGQFVFQSNIPFGVNQDWTFSPALEVKVQFAQSEEVHLVLPLQLGHKFVMGHRNLFIPKVGLALGFASGRESAAIVGPNMELAFEFGHFIVAVDGYYSINKPDDTVSGFTYEHKNPFSAGISFGYKF